MNILSLFDGIGCGRIALDRASVSVDKYYASEIDSSAIRVSHPDSIQLGDVNNWRDWNLDHVDILMGGNPCESFSSIGEGGAFDDARGKLFWVYRDILQAYKPKYFLLENVRMKQEYRDIISSCLGVDCVEINSSLVSGQNRKRLYWTNIPFTMPQDKGITLDSVINHDTYEGLIKESTWIKRVPPELPKYCDPYNKKSITSNKSTTLRTNVNNGNMWVRTAKGYRNLTVTECELLQTVTPGYTKGVSPSVAKKLLGKGWTVDVIAHILRGLK